MPRLRRYIKLMVRKLGWDIVRYRPPWPTLLGVEQLPIRTVLDIGAYDGDTARILRRFFPQAHIYCFEPQQEPVQALEAWAATQQGMVHVLPYALGNRTGMVELRRNARFPRITTLAEPGPGTQRGMQDAIVLSAPVMRLDDVVSAHIPLQDGLLIKLDVEGGEWEVLAGGAATLPRCVACIMELCVAPLYVGQMTLTETIDLLGEFGLEYGGALQQQCRGDGRVFYFDAIFVDWARGKSMASPSSPGSGAKGS